MNTTEKFSGRAENYAASRPSYSTELINCLYERHGLANAQIIADIGSGTGKFSQQLLDRHSEVYCVEPNADMRHAAEDRLSGYENFHSVAGSAEHTTLKNDFADSITVAQAFHWFDVAKFKQECLRIIKPDGRVFLIWNLRDNNDAVNREWHNVFLRYCPGFNGFSNGIENDDPKIKAFFDKGYERISFDYPLMFSRENFIKRSLSSSYSLKEGDDEYAAYISSLNRLFDSHERNGQITIANCSVAYVGVIK